MTDELSRLRKILDDRHFLASKKAAKIQNNILATQKDRDERNLLLGEVEGLKYALNSLDMICQLKLPGG